MKNTDSIITIGLCPCWDITCKVFGLDWGLHKKIDSQTVIPAGKAFNISRALAWLGTKSIAAGLWGKSDYQQMIETVDELGDFVDIKFTPVKGRTRQNITVVDTQNHREFHLRAPGRLAASGALNQLKKDLKSIVSAPGVCVFAGQMPGAKLLDDVVSIVSVCKDAGAEIAVDTSGPALKRMVDTGAAWLIKPNVEELCELLGEQIENEASVLARAAEKLCEKVDIVVISRGDKGAVVITPDITLEGRFIPEERNIVSTVACGDYFLAGFLDGLKEKGDLNFALERAIKVAAARAWGWTDDKKWTDVKNEIKTEVSVLG